MTTSLSQHTTRQNSTEQQESLDRLIRAREAGVARDIRAAEHDVICNHLSVATTLAGRYRDRGVDFEDLHQLARLGLIKAVKRWRPEVGADFLPFAFPTILGEMKRYFRDHSRTIRMPRSVQELHAEATLLARDLEQRLGRPAGEQELAKAVGVEVSDIRAQQAAADSCRTLSLDLKAVHDAAVDQACGDAGADLERVEDEIVVKRAMALLTDRERRVLKLRYFEGQSQQQIGEAIGVSQMQVSRILRGVLTKLRDEVGDQADFHRLSA